MWKVKLQISLSLHFILPEICICIIKYFSLTIPFNQSCYFLHGTYWKPFDVFNVFNKLLVLK